MYLNILKKLFDHEYKELRRFNSIADKVMALDEEYSKLTDTELQNKTEEFKERIEVLNFKDFPTLYGGFLNNSLVEDNGKTIYFQVSQWSPIYNTSLFKVIFK